MKPEKSSDLMAAFYDVERHQPLIYAFLTASEGAALSATSQFWSASYKAVSAACPIEHLQQLIAAMRDDGGKIRWTDASIKRFVCLLSAVFNRLGLHNGSEQAVTIVNAMGKIELADQMLVMCQLLSSPAFFKLVMAKGSIDQWLSLGLEKVTVICECPAIQAWQMAEWQQLPLAAFTIKWPLTNAYLSADQVTRICQMQQQLLLEVKRQLPESGAAYHRALNSIFYIRPDSRHYALLRSYHAYTSMLSTYVQFCSGPLALYLMATWASPKALLRIPQAVLNNTGRWIRFTSNRRLALYQVLSEHTHDVDLLRDQGRIDALVRVKFAALPKADDKFIYDKSADSSTLLTV